MSAAQRFRGFPAGSRATAIPNLFYSDLLPAIDDPAELTVSLAVFFLLGRKGAASRWLTEEALAAEAPLHVALARLPGGAATALRRGLEAAVARGTLARVETARGSLYTVNDAGTRMLPAGAIEEAPPLAGADRAALPSIYALYEENLGAISPLIADELRAAEEDYPAAWVEEAFREAVAQNRRSWRYVARILERWREEGRHDAAVGRVPETRRDLAGRYRGLIRR